MNWWIVAQCIYAGSVKLCNMLKTISVRKKTKQRLDAIADDKSINKFMRELLDNTEVVEDVKEGRFEFANIHIDEDLWDKLKRCKIHSKESHSDVIERLLDNYQVADD